MSRVLASLTCITWFVSTAFAEDFIVTNLNDAGVGSLRDAVAKANVTIGLDAIRFRKHLKGTIKLTSNQIEIADDLVITGIGASRLAVSGNNASRIFKIRPEVKVSIEDMTIADGRNSLQESVPILVTRGGAILNDGGTLRLSRVTMRNNITMTPGNSQVVGGGAIVNSGFAMLVATDCEFIDNIARGGTRYAFGGAIGNVTESVAIVKNCTFTGNDATSGATSYGGAIGNFGGSELTVSECKFYGNTARGVEFGQVAFGGAISTRPGTVDGSGSLTTIERSLFVANFALGADGGFGQSGADAGGGALYNVDSTLSLESSILHKNEAYGGRGDLNGGNAYGGALLNDTSGFMWLSLSTISNNRACGSPNGLGIGGGLYNLSIVVADSSTNRRIVGNKASTSNDNVFGTITRD